MPFSCVYLYENGKPSFLRQARRTQSDAQAAHRRELRWSRAREVRQILPETSWDPTALGSDGIRGNPMEARANAQNTMAPGSPGVLSWRAEVDHLKRENEGVDQSPDDGFRPPDYPTRPLLSGRNLDLNRQQMTLISDGQRTSETEDGFRASDYPIRPIVWPGLIQLNAHKLLQQQISEQQAKKNRAEQGTRQKSSFCCVYLVEASEVEAVTAGRTG